MRKANTSMLAIFGFTLLVAGCGGGGGDSNAAAREVIPIGSLPREVQGTLGPGDSIFNWQRADFYSITLTDPLPLKVMFDFDLVDDVEGALFTDGCLAAADASGWDPCFLEQIPYYGGDLNAGKTLPAGTYILVVSNFHDFGSIYEDVPYTMRITNDVSPVIVGVHPDPGTLVSPSTGISISLDEPLDFPEYSDLDPPPVTVMDSAGMVPVRVRYWVNYWNSAYYSAGLGVEPMRILEPGPVTVMVDAGVADVWGNPLGADFSWTFQARQPLITGAPIPAVAEIRPGETLTVAIPTNGVACEIRAWLVDMSSGHWGGEGYSDFVPEGTISIPADIDIPLLGTSPGTYVVNVMAYGPDYEAYSLQLDSSISTTFYADDYSAPTTVPLATVTIVP